MSATTHGLGVHFDAIIGTAVTFVILVTGTTVLRVTAKLLTNAPFKFEDYTIFLAYVLYIVTEGLLMRCKVPISTPERLAHNAYTVVRLF